MNKDLGFKSVFKDIIKYFSTEELFFGLATVVTVVSPYNSIVPALTTLILLAFYYFFFGWFMFRNERKTNFLFSIIAGIVYSVCLVSIAIIITGDFYKTFFYIMQFIILVVYYIYLSKLKNIGFYRSSHYIRIGIIIALNVYLYIIK
ncbi:cbb3-type cytochrome oxidase subunit 3 [Pedobacter sp. W3I1]|nr:cbb3-type cytochrome oxidase subunit 3 [Pedobacter sp. W3I1]